MESKAEMTALMDKGLLQTTELYEYLLETSVYPREAESLKELRALTTSHPWGPMATAPDAGQFMALMLKLINAKKTIEIGVFTGYSLLLTALTIPDDGKITAIDVDRSAYEIGLPVIEKVGMKHKINFIESEALPVLDQLLKDPENRGTFDFVFVDADKENYKNYHERVLELLKRGGVVIYDNTLWGGTVAMPEHLAPVRVMGTRSDAIEFNKYLAADARVQISQVPLGDGITICRRL
ncbi:UNVERIFIED_CONTAM: putative caffeoyl-CoA O-methyltransferase [Sesamum latifolium]|uniref:Caffeoyl-CoA O-methyltransferase n=1 Tax=Sesamum latifolium TaxID=2727402 RepID=A0AAW2VH06_9LAMI